MREFAPAMGPKNEGFFNSVPELLTGEEPEGFNLYRLHPNEREMAMYEGLGVKQFKLFYLATIGRLIKRLSGQKFIEGTSIEAIDKAIDSTLTLETMHTMGGMFMTMGEVGMYGNGNFAAGTVSVALNVLVNLYPVFMQRANRYEILKAKKRKLAIQEGRQKSKEGKPATNTPAESSSKTR